MIILVVMQVDLNFNLKKSLTILKIRKKFRIRN